MESGLRWASLFGTVFVISAGAQGARPGRVAFPHPSQIYAVRIDGSGLTDLSRSPDRESFDPAVSPNGRKIAFIRAAYDQHTDLWVMRADGSHQRRYARVRDARSPSWSADGRLIAFEIGASSPGGTAVIDLKGRVLGRWRRFWEPHWSPDSKRLALVSIDGRRLGLVTWPKPGARILTRFPRGMQIGNVAWAPSGGQLAFNVSTATVGKRPDDGGIDLASLSGRVRRIVSGSVGPPTWDQKGRKIAFSQSQLESGNYVSRIWVVAAAGGVPERLGDQGLERSQAPAWSPDGTRIAFAGSPFGYPGQSWLYVMNADGTNARQVTARRLAWQGSWMPDSRRLIFSS